ncbi:vanadium-dependent haloperoxidase [Dyadobacter sp. CY326]|uniref:vanadium-dependent haloperoxidase n=1 Tax=Dyadobacter sp. CY326 TaxID=2907300 RepID=UPI001F2F0E5A|nr:vanadium-dependent haloperoxidase [Dyadobacter sp. CY326]MCE7064560.1 vanadium-dependent haloperoxidase [Dyadobacter sp. CY326]
MIQIEPLKQLLRALIILFICALINTSCTDHEGPQTPDAGSYPADVVNSWLTMQLKLSQAMPGPPPIAARRFAYAGIALYESIVPGLVGYQSIAPQLNGLPALPKISTGMSYYWPASANAALAEMNRSLFPAITAARKASVDSLEAANWALYLPKSSAAELERSAAFGKEIAASILAWAKTDGYDNTTPYQLVPGAEHWVPTPPAFAAAILSNWGANRLIVSNSDANAPQGAPMAYSEDPASPYFAQAKEVYDISQSLTGEQKIIATFWPDNSWHNVLSQILAIEKPKLDVAAVAFTQLGIAMSDASVSLLKEKYFYNTVRPVTYIRSVMNKPAWNTLIPTPPHPEYPSGHAVISSAAAQTLTRLFGENYHYTDTPYNLVGFSPRSFNSFNEAAAEAAISRVYAGIHYRKTCEVSLIHGKIIADNIAQKLKFKP